MQTRWDRTHFSERVERILDTKEAMALKARVEVGSCTSDEEGCLFDVGTLHFSKEAVEGVPNLHRHVKVVGHFECNHLRLQACIACLQGLLSSIPWFSEIPRTSLCFIALQCCMAFPAGTADPSKENHDGATKRCRWMWFHQQTRIRKCSQ